MDPHLRDLRYFVAVAEELSFTRAATERLYVSQPALSKQVRQLERRLRAELFVRGHRSVALTAAGAALLPHARTLLAEWDAALGDVQAAAASEQQTLTVGFQTRIGRGVVAGITAAMERQLPGWRLQFRQISWADPTVGLAGGGVDVSVGWLPVPPEAGLATKVLRTEDRWVALPRGHRLAGRPTIAFDELRDEPFIALPASAGPMRAFWLAGEQRATAARIGAEAGSADETYELVAAGVGVVLLAAGNALDYRRDDVVVAPVPDLPPCELAVLWRAADRRTAVQVAVEACCRCETLAPAS